MLHVFDLIYSHLDKPGTSIWLMFYDFSSAFNTIQPHLLADKLLAMKIHPTIILWVLDYFTNCLQFVQLKPKSHIAESRPSCHCVRCAGHQHGHTTRHSALLFVHTIQLTAGHHTIWLHCRQVCRRHCFWLTRSLMMMPHINNRRWTILLTGVMETA